MATKNEVSLADYVGLIAFLQRKFWPWSQQLPEGALAKSGNKPDRMVDIAFDDMSPWFSRLTNPIENAYTQGMNSGNNKSATYIGLGKLAKKANDFMAQLSAYVNRDIGAKPEVRVPQYVSIQRSTLRGQCLTRIETTQWCQWQIRSWTRSDGR